MQYGKDHDFIYALGEIEAVRKTIYQAPAHTAPSFWELTRVLDDSFQKRIELC